ncbi:hypothetical protein BH23GEM6_BH23GEM6_10370 [soil metagenome]
MSSRIRLAILIAASLIVLVLIGSLVQGLGSGAAGTIGSTEAEDVERDRVRVEVLNASGIAGLARRGTERLRAHGFDVVYFGNAGAFGPDSSLVIDRVGNRASAEAVAAALGLSAVQSASDTTLYVDVTVVLGRDWDLGRRAR